MDYSAKRKADLEAQYAKLTEIQQGLESPDYNASVDVLLNLITSLNDAGFYDHALAIQQTVVDLDNKTRAIKRINNPGYTYR